MHVNDLLKAAVEKGASDLHLKVGSYPMCRVHGHLAPISEEKQLDHKELVEMAASIMSTAQRQKFKDSQEVDLAGNKQTTFEEALRWATNVDEFKLMAGQIFNKPGATPAPPPPTAPEITRFGS